MSETTNQEQPINLKRKLSALSSGVRKLLESETHDPKSLAFYEANLKDLILNLVFLGLLSPDKLAEIDQKKDSRERIEELLIILDTFFKTDDEDLIESVVPEDVLKELVEKLEISEAEKEELQKEIEAKNEARLAQIKRQFTIRDGLNNFTRETVAEQEEIAEVASVISSKLQSELSDLRDQVEKARGSEEVTEEYLKQGQEIYQKTIEELDVLPELKQYFSSRKLSAKTVAELATTEDPDKTKQIIQQLLTPLSIKKKEFVQKEIIPELAAEAATITEVEDVQPVAALVVGENLQKLQEAGFSQNEIHNLIFDLSEKTETLVKENPPQNVTFTTAPAVTLIQDKVHVSLTAPQPPENPQGKVINLLVDGQNTLAQKIIKKVATQEITPQTVREIKNEISVLKVFKLTIQGYSPEELEKIAAIKTKEGTRTSSNQSHELRNLANQLRFFQQNFPRPLLTKIWQSNRLKAIRETVNKIPSPKKFVTQKITTWIAKTSIGKGIKRLSAEVAQKGLQKLFELISKETAKKVAGTTFKVVLTKIVTALSIDALAGALTGGIGTVVLLAVQLVWEGIKFVVNVGKKFIVALFGGLIKEEDLQLKKLFFLIFAVMIFLPTLTINNDIGGAFLSEGRGGLTEELPGNPVFQSGEPNCENPQFAEKIICKLSKGGIGCQYNVIDEFTWSYAQNCLSRSDFERVDAIKTAFTNHLISMCDKPSKTPECKKNLQCVGFTVGVEAGQGRRLESRNAKEYLNSPNPSGYELIPGDKRPEKGYLAVWKGTTYGHIAVVIDIDDSKETLDVANANGYTGEISIEKDIPYGKSPMERGIGPNGFLRPL